MITGVHTMFTSSEPHEHEDGSTHAHGPALGGNLYFDVDDVDAVYAEVTAKGIRPFAAPQDQPYGMRDFGLEDPNGFVIFFASPTS